MNKDKQFQTLIKAEHRLFDLHLKETYRFRDLIFLFVRRDFTAKYKQNAPGPLRAIITTFRYAIFRTGFFSLPYDLISCGISLLIFRFGLILFSRIEQSFMDTIQEVLPWI